MAPNSPQQRPQQPPTRWGLVGGGTPNALGVDPLLLRGTLYPYVKRPTAFGQEKATYHALRRGAGVGHADGSLTVERGSALEPTPGAMSLVARRGNGTRMACMTLPKLAG